MGKNTYFAFKQFRVEQAACAMKVTTDACIFGAWAPVEQARQILDIGTGTGLLALMAAQRSPATVDAVDMDAASARMAKANFAASPWPGRLCIFNARIQDFRPAHEGYDVVLCNPPFFPDGTRSPEPERARSRHSETLPHNELLDALNRLMTSDARACILLPEGMADAFAVRADGTGLREERRLYIRSTPGRPPHCRATVFSRTPGPPVEEDLVVYSAPPQYSPETAERLRPYYLYL